MKNIKITIENADNTKLELTVPQETSIEEWALHLRAILKFITFVDKTIDEILIKEDEAINSI
jgi:hypothetical protein